MLGATIDVQGMDTAAARGLANGKGPCITMFLPDHHPGAQAGSRTAMLREMVHRAQESLESARLAEEELLSPLNDLGEDPQIEKGGNGLAIFRNPNGLNVFRLPGSRINRVVLGSHFMLLPILERAYTAQHFFILGISTKHLRLLEYRFGVCEELALPAKVPPTLEAAGGFDRPDHDLENRSTAGHGAGTMKAVHFGTLSDREAADQYLAHYLALVDQGLKSVLGRAPLLLAGVREEIAAYRRVSRYANVLMPEIQGNIEFLPREEIARAASDAAAESYRAAARKVLQEYREMPGRNRTLDDPALVLRAAADGRIHRLCVRDGTEHRGKMEPELDSLQASSEDLLNAAAVETLRNGGEVFVLPQDEMPVSRPVAAILRF